MSLKFDEKMSEKKEGFSPNWHDGDAGRRLNEINGLLL
jgi:hypothetical protein